MKKLTLRAIAACGLAASLALFAFSCGGDDDDNGGGGTNTSGTGCAAFVCDASGKVRQGAQGTDDGYSTNVGCSYKDVGTCKAGCDTNRTIVKLPGCDVGNACNLIDRQLPAAGSVTADTKCTKEVLSDADACNGYPCLSRNATGMDTIEALRYCAVVRCTSDENCAADEFCRCHQERQDDGTYISESWCVKKAQ